MELPTWLYRLASLSKSTISGRMVYHWSQLTRVQPHSKVSKGAIRLADHKSSKDPGYRSPLASRCRKSWSCGPQQNRSPPLQVWYWLRSPSLCFWCELSSVNQALSFLRGYRPSTDIWDFYWEQELLRGSKLISLRFHYGQCPTLVKLLMW